MKKKIKKFSFRSSIKWNAILFVAVIFASFILPVMPLLWQKSLAKLVYAIIYFSTILSLEKRSYNLLILFFLTFLLFLVSAIFNFDLLENISRGLNICLFLGIVILLLRQIIMAKDVSAKIIFDSIMGYLLLGVIYSIFVAFILRYDPGSYANAQISSSDSGNIANMSVSLYYSFVSLASLGYGDIVPLKPYTRSLATFIAISGQFYITVIVALLVGKYSARQKDKKNNDESG